MLRRYSLFAVAAGALVGCTTTQGDNAVVIVSNEAPAAGCVLTAETNTSILSAGIMDVASFSDNAVFGYQLTPMVQNFATADIQNQTQVEQRTAFVSGAHVDITFASTAYFTAADQAALDSAGLLHFDSRFAGAINPNGGLSVFNFQIVPAGVFNAIQKKFVGAPPNPATNVDMIVKVVVFGTFNDGNFETNPFEYPVTACDGCLTDNRGPCTSLPQSFIARTGGACFTPQDGVLDCCTDAGGNAICPAVATTPGA